MLRRSLASLEEYTTERRKRFPTIQCYFAIAKEKCDRLCRHNLWYHIFRAAFPISLRSCIRESQTCLR